MLGVGFFFMRQNKTPEDYYVGGRNMSSWHVGLSVVATDVGGGFSIALGGLGFTMGLSGSWMLFTGLIGAWLSAVLLIPKIKQLSTDFRILTFPQIFARHYGANVALVAGIISGIGYLGFTSSQLLAGAKLTSSTFDTISMDQALITMGIIAVVYTVLGGLKAVIFTDTIQWIILLAGLIFIGIPMSVHALGGIDAVIAAADPQMLSLQNITWVQLVNWAITIIPIWFVGMTLYQRIYACKNEKDAKKAWFIAGLFEYPIMAFLGVTMGLLAKIAMEHGMLDGVAAGASIDEETGLPLLLKSILPAGIMGLMLSAYFSAILSTADSCLMAASGNVVTDIIARFFHIEDRNNLRISMIVTFFLGAIALLLAMSMDNVLDLMLKSYAFMVSGLLVPVIGMIFWKKRSAIGALAAMIGGGTTTLLLQHPDVSLPFGLDPNVFGIAVSALLFIIFTNTNPLPSHARETS